MTHITTFSHRDIGKAHDLGAERLQKIKLASDLGKASICKITFGSSDEGGRVSFIGDEIFLEEIHLVRHAVIDKLLRRVSEIEKKLTAMGVDCSDKETAP